MAVNLLQRLFCLHIVFVAACGANANSASAPVGAGSKSGAGQKKAVPADLKSFESNGEGLSEAPITGDWAKAQGILDQAKITWTALKPGLAADGANASSVAKIDDLLTKYASDVRGKSAREAETDANAISFVVPDLFDLYEFPVPTDALRLDAEYRLVQIHGEYADWTAASSELDRAKAVWARLKSVVTSQAAKRTRVAGAVTVIADVDAVFASTASAISGKSSSDTIAQTTRGLDLVDVVEQVFE
jgi:hypothetical protein